MESNKKRLGRLINANSLSKEDQKWLAEYLNTSDLSELSYLSMEEFATDVDKTEKMLDLHSSRRLLRDIHSSLDLKRQTKSMLFMKIAAVLLIALCFGIYFFSAKNHFGSYPTYTNIRDVKPGENKAVLTLGDGTKIVLEQSDKKIKIDKANMSITQRSEGQLIYQVNDGDTLKNSKIEYNTISTPFAGQYHVVLSDGTRVWLNANSSIRFPTIFNAKERVVEITGEAYFEVAKNKKVPFKALAANQVVEVLGTYFNLNAYSDESSIKTTLIEGSVKIVKGKESVLLKPGEQAQTKKTIKIVKSSDVESEISWKSGTFYFKDAGIEEVMRQAGRWYDLEVNYEGKMPLKQLNGKIPRNISLSKFLNILEYSGVKFRIDGRQITITE